MEARGGCVGGARRRVGDARGRVGGARRRVKVAWLARGGRAGACGCRSTAAGYHCKYKYNLKILNDKKIFIGLFSSN